MAQVFFGFLRQYPVPAAQSEQVRLFMEKLREKKQSTVQQNQAAHAVSLILKYCAKAKPTILHHMRENPHPSHPNCHRSGKGQPLYPVPSLKKALQLLGRYFLSHGAGGKTVVQSNHPPLPSPSATAFPSIYSRQTI